MSGVKTKRNIEEEEIERALQEDSESEYEDDDTDYEVEDNDDEVAIEPSPSTSRASPSSACKWRKIGNVRDTSLCDLDCIPEFIVEHNVLGFEN
jgi:hypothetical protein